VQAEFPVRRWPGMLESHRNASALSGLISEGKLAGSVSPDLILVNVNDPAYSRNRVVAFSTTGGKIVLKAYSPQPFGLVPNSYAL
jgi:hypothetical protein